MRSIQNEYIRNADITPNWEDIRNAYINELGEIAIFEYLIVQKG